jgi:signal transduction histidine kinase
MQKENTFIAALSHEIKKPIAVILGFAEILNNNELPYEKIKEIAKTIIKTGKKMEDIIKDLLILMEIEKKDLLFKKINLSDLIESSKHEIEFIYKHKIVFEKKCDVGIFVNESLFLSAIKNLLENAIKYSKGKKEIFINLQKTNKSAVVSIKDKGIGISKEKIPFIFDPFYVVDKDLTKKIGGSGLGLFIVKKIVEAHRGEIKVISSEKGSNFILEFPR